MGIGLSAITNNELLESIRKNHIWGSYSAEDFVEIISEGSTFFAVEAGEYGIGNVTENIFIRFSDTTKEKYIYKKKKFDSNYYEVEREGFVSDLFSGAKAVFFSFAKEEAEAYRQELKDYEEELYGII